MRVEQLSRTNGEDFRLGPARSVHRWLIQDSERARANFQKSTLQRRLVGRVHKAKRLRKALWANPTSLTVLSRAAR